MFTKAFGTKPIKGSADTARLITAVFPHLAKTVSDNDSIVREHLVCNRSKLSDVATYATSIWAASYGCHAFTVKASNRIARFYITREYGTITVADAGIRVVTKINALASSSDASRHGRLLVEAYLIAC